MKTLRLIGNVTCTNDMLEGSAFFADMSVDQALSVIRAAEAVSTLGAKKIFLPSYFSVREFSWRATRGHLFMTSADIDKWAKNKAGSSLNCTIKTETQYVVTDGTDFWFQTSANDGSVYLTDACSLITLREFVK